MGTQTLLLFMFVSVISGCVNAYSPMTPPAPLLERAGEVSAIGRMRLGDPRRGAAGTIAVAPTRSSRVVASFDLARDRGRKERYHDANEENGRPSVDATRAELGAGWGMARRHLVVEALAGGGYGVKDVAYCQHDWQEGGCGPWVKGHARVVHGFVQGHAAAAFNLWRGGGGLRLQVSHDAYEELGGRTSAQSVTVPSIEPFIVQRLVLPYVSFEAQLQFAILLRYPKLMIPVAPSDTLVSVYPYRLPLPRIWLGAVIALDELWRDRRPYEASR
jgi:hypothetical protein